MERSFYNGRTGREEVTLERHVRQCELHDREWTEEYWIVFEPPAMGIPHCSYAAALADYEARIVRRAQPAAEPDDWSLEMEEESADEARARMTEEEKATDQQWEAGRG